MTNKITNTMYGIVVSSKFEKQLKKLNKQGKDIEKLKAVIKKLANGEKLDAKYRDHQLINAKKYNNCRECHIEPDWLLIYRIKNYELELYLFRTGSHSDLF